MSTTNKGDNYLTFNNEKKHCWVYCAIKLVIEIVSNFFVWYKQVFWYNQQLTCVPLRMSKF